MTNLLHNLQQKVNIPHFLERTKFVAKGLAHDFWVDGDINPIKNIRFLGSDTSAKRSAKDIRSSSKSDFVKPATKAHPEWHALPGEISEKMWGEDAVAPGGDAVYDMLLKSLGLNKQMSALDLSAGLGWRMRKAAEEFGVYFTGLEPDAAIAERGMEISLRTGNGKHAIIAHYIPAEFVPGKTVDRLYDCIIARETFYRITNKSAFFTSLAACTKSGAQLSFTDYIVDPEHKNHPAIQGWINFEKGAVPVGVVEMAELWAKAGFTLRVHDDQSAYYRKEVMTGMKRFAQFLATGIRPDVETRTAIAKRMNVWIHRMAAMENGMKFYRFYGTK
jgi:cyclopropane fatty-acyl-phospholipid synthase-like methyltransferase